MKYYYIQLQNMLLEESKFTFNLDGHDLYEFDRLLYHQLINFPAEIIQIFDKVVQNLYKNNFASNEELIQNSNRILVAIKNIKQTSNLRLLRPKHINTLVSIKCIIIRVSDIYPEMKIATFKCTFCKNYAYAPLERAHVDEPNSCEICLTKNSF